MIKLLHISDVHLDSPYAGVELALGERLRAGLSALFAETIRSAVDYDLILIPGDLFDCGYVSPDTLALVRDAFADFHGEIVIAPGNHDPYTTGSVWNAVEWSDNVHIFTRSELSSFSLTIRDIPVSVHGWAFTSDRLDISPLSFGLSPTPGAINLICAHADTASPISKYAPTPLSLFAASGCDYAALGHIHNPPEIALSGHTTVAYSGFLEGRSFDEEGDGGALSVTVFGDTRPPVTEKLTLSRHSYLTRHIDVTGEDSDSAVADRIAACVVSEKIGADKSLKVYIEGSVPPDYIPDTARIAELVPMKTEPHSWRPSSVTLRDRTSPVFGAEHLADDLSIKGELYRTLLPRLSSADPDERALAAEALRIGLLALDGKAFL